MTDRVYITADTANEAEHYHTRACQGVSDSTLTEITRNTAHNNGLHECSVCSGESLVNGTAGDLADMSPSEVGL